MTVRPALVLATCCLSLVLMTMDVTIVNVALPSIRADLHASVSGLQWSIDGYTVVIASFLVLAGSTADRVGRRRVFQTGLAIFCLGSLLCSLAPTTGALVAFRIVQATGGSMMNPVAMSIITNVYVEPKARARAIGIWGAVVGLSMALGPLVGGTLTETVGWRAIFWINVPIGIAAILLTRKFVPESRADKPRRPDLIGQACVVVALAALTSATIEGPEAGWTSPWIIGGYTLVVAAIATLIAYERRRAEPLVDLRFFRSVPFASATAIAVVAFIAFSGTLFLASLYLQDTRQLAPARAGLCMLPVALAMMVCAPVSGRVVASRGPRRVLVGGGAAIVASALLLVMLAPDTPLAQVIVAFTLFGVGLGLVNPPITNTAVSGMPRAQAGVAAALASTSRQIGATLGVALAGSVAGHGGADFAAETRPVWWIVAAAGCAIVVLGLSSTGARARTSAERVAHLLD